MATRLEMIRRDSRGDDHGGHNNESNTFDTVRFLTYDSRTRSRHGAAPRIPVHGNRRHFERGGHVARAGHAPHLRQRRTAVVLQLAGDVRSGRDDRREPRESVISPRTAHHWARHLAAPRTTDVQPADGGADSARLSSEPSGLSRLRSGWPGDHPHGRAQWPGQLHVIRAEFLLSLERRAVSVGLFDRGGVRFK